MWLRTGTHSFRHGFQKKTEFCLHTAPSRPHPLAGPSPLHPASSGHCRAGAVTHALNVFSLAAVPAACWKNGHDVPMTTARLHPSSDSQVLFCVTAAAPSASAFQSFGGWRLLLVAALQRSLVFSRCQFFVVVVGGFFLHPAEVLRKEKTVATQLCENRGNAENTLVSKAWILN